MAPRRRRSALLSSTKKQKVEPCTVLSVLMKNGWISARDLCRLEATSKSNKTWIEENDVWSELCCRRWPNTSSIFPSFVRLLGGYKMLFRHRISAPVAVSPFPPLPPPKLQLNQFSLLVDIYVGGESAYPDSLLGLDLDSLLETGRIGFSTKSPFVVGKARCWDNNDCNCKSPKCHFDNNEYDARIHLLSEANEGTSCCIYQPGGKEWSTSMNLERVGDPKNGLYDWKNSTSEWLRCFRPFYSSAVPIGLAFQNTKESVEIQKRLQTKIAFKFSLRLHVIEPGDKIAVAGFYIEAQYYDTTAFGCWKTYNSEYAKKTGVSLLHVVEQLKGLEKNGETLSKGEAEYVHEGQSVNDLDL